MCLWLIGNAIYTESDDDDDDDDATYNDDDTMAVLTSTATAVHFSWLRRQVGLDARDYKFI